jgi:hypothetical protein
MNSLEPNRFDDRGGAWSERRDGTSHLTEWLSDAAQVLFVVAIATFGGYAISGIIRDARAM